jgi:hypothetical protein
MFEKGQRVTIVQNPDSGNFMSEWEGYEAIVVRDNGMNSMTLLNPIASRPDGHGMIQFFWETPDLKEVG